MRIHRFRYSNLEFTVHDITKEIIIWKNSRRFHDCCRLVYYKSFRWKLSPRHLVALSIYISLHPFKRFFYAAGVLCLIPVSMYAKLVADDFWDPAKSNNDIKYTFGPALYVAWFSAVSKITTIPSFGILATRTHFSLS